MEKREYYVTVDEMKRENSAEAEEQEDKIPREKMKRLADAFCFSACSPQKALDCDCQGTSCEQLAWYLFCIKKFKVFEK